MITGKPTAYFKFANAKYNGKKVTKIELFKAVKWKRKWRPFKRTMNPTPPMNGDSSPYWEDNYRIRIDGVWRRSASCKYLFFSLGEVLDLLEDVEI